MLDTCVIAIVLLSPAFANGYHVENIQASRTPNQIISVLGYCKLIVSFVQTIVQRLVKTKLFYSYQIALS